MNSQSIWTITVCKIKGIAYYAHMSLLLILFWVGYDTYQSSQSIPNAIIHSAVFLAVVVIYEFCKLGVLATSPAAFKSITLYPFGGLSNSDRSLALEHAQSENARDRAVRLACIPPILLALLAIILYAWENVSPANETLQLAFLSAAALSTLLLLPVSPYPGGRLFVHLCKTRASIPAYIPTLVKFLSLILLCVAAIQSDSVAFTIVSAVYVGIALEQHIFERSRAAAQRFTAQDALIPLDSLISFSHSITCEHALQQALLSFQPIFPVFHMKEPIGYVEKNALLQFTEDSYGPLVSEVTTKTVSHVSPRTPLSLILSIFRESHAPLLFVFNEENECLGLLVKDKVIEFLVIKSAEERFDPSDSNDPPDLSDDQK